MAFRFDLNAIADLEEKYESHAALKERMQEKPGTILRDIIATHVLECAPEVAGRRMIDEELNNYYAGIEAALSLAYGATVEQAGKVAAARLELIAVYDTQTIATLEKAMTLLLGDSASPGANGSGSGSRSRAKAESKVSGG